MKSLCSCHVYPGLLDGERSVAQSWRFLDPLKWIFGPRILPGSNSLWRLHNENALICFPLAISSWLTGSCLLLSAIPGSLSVRSIWLWLFSFLSTSLYFSLSQADILLFCMQLTTLRPVFPPPSSPSPFPPLCLLFSGPSFLLMYCCGVYMGISRIPGTHCISDPWSGSFTPRLPHARHPSPQTERWG